MYRLIATDLTKRFGPRKVFSKISFNLQTGDSLAVVGPNGSGKTTLLMTLLGAHQPTSGTVAFSENDANISDDRRRMETSLVAPYLNLYDNLTGEENLTFFATVSGSHVTGREINDLLARVGLEGRGDDLLRAYSSGMKQRLKYAVALLQNPAFLFLDEPTANLDEAGKRIVFDIIEQSRKSRIIVIATNEPEEQKLAGAICRVDG
jgi:heme exporter protein A